MAITLEREGSRLYFVGNTFPVKDRIKSLGGHWDGDRKAWWIGVGKQSDAESLLRSITEAAPAPAGESQSREPSEVTEDPRSIRLVAKCRYKGRLYYARFIGETKRGYAARLLSLDGQIQFWATCARGNEADGSGDVACIVKRYEPREYRGRTEYMTLYSMQRFCERQADPERRRGQCYECGSWGPSGEPCKDCGGEGSYQ